MDCAEEVSLLRRELSRREGIYDLAFDVLNGRMTVEFDPARIPPGGIEQAVAAAGMNCEPWRDAAEPAESAPRAVLTALAGISLLAAMALHGIDRGNLLLGILDHETGAGPLAKYAAGLSAVTLLLGLRGAAPKAWLSARRLRPDMNALVCLSALGAAALGDWLEAATLAFLYSLAGHLEAWSLSKARRAVGSLLELAGAEATVLHAHGEHRMPASGVAAGSLVRIRPGERILFDGEITGGSSGVDQALITGESVPIFKQPGDRVYAGTMNIDGVLEVRTSRPAPDTTLNRMLRMVGDSRQRRAPAERLIERFAHYYTPAMIALALAVAVAPPLAGLGPWSVWAYRGMLALLISCPCALVISTPVTIAAALASAARKGVLIKGGAYLEAAGRLKAVAFDKIGVLTAGEPEVERLIAVSGRALEEILPKLAAVEAPSEHPLARAVMRYSEASGARAEAASAFQSLPGLGVEAETGGEIFWIGGNRMLAERGASTAALRGWLAGLEDAERTVLYFGSGSEVWAILVLTDRVLREAPSAMAALRASGVGWLAMLTGDNASTARAAGRALGMDEVLPELLPEEKASAVEALREKYGTVGMAGDGINDIDGMEAASVGIALGARATDLALETADVVIAGDLHKLAFLVRHGRRALSVIRQNLALALAAKAAFAVLAALGLAALWMAVLADTGATLLVTFNGLRLLRTGGGDFGLPGQRKASASQR